MATIKFNEPNMPKFGKDAFNCPHCGTLAQQGWSGDGGFYAGGRYIEPNDFQIRASRCTGCHRECLWVDKKMVLPDSGSAPPPRPDMPADVKKHYAEAASIVQKSHRAAAALLRLALDKLCVEMGAKGENLHDKVGYLMEKKGLPRLLVESMDTVRVFGNAAVHIGNINLQEDNETVPALFMLINFIIDKLITEPKAIKAITDRVPQSKRRKNLPPENGTAE